LDLIEIFDLPVPKWNTGTPSSSRHKNSLFNPIMPNSFKLLDIFLFPQNACSAQELLRVRNIKYYVVVIPGVKQRKNFCPTKKGEKQ